MVQESHELTLPEQPLPELMLPEQLLPEASASPYTELHRRTVQGPVDQVWPHCLAVTGPEIRLLGPLMTLRSLPRLLRHGRAGSAAPHRPLLDEFVSEGFVLLRRDPAPVEGRAVVLVGAAGKFWSPSGNAPLRFTSAQEFLDFQEPGYAKTVASLEVIDLGGGATRIQTETWVNGTDATATRKFAPYWAIIRGPSGLIRRSWLAAVDRRVKRSVDDR
jgi:hypothetical protein